MARLVRNPEVVATELEDGAVLLNMQSGLYYSLNESALEIWRALEYEDGFAGLTARFDLDPERATAAGRAFAELLERESLLVSSDEEPAAPFGTPPPPRERRPFAEPELIKHDEPLHEVSMSPFDPQLPLAE